MTRGDPVTCVVQRAQSNFAVAASAAAPRETVGDAGLIFTQYVDAKDAVFEHRIGNRTAMMDANEQRRLRRIGRHGTHRGNRDPVTPRVPVCRHDIDRAGSMAHAIQKSLPQQRIVALWSDGPPIPSHRGLKPAARARRRASRLTVGNPISRSRISTLFMRIQILDSMCVEVARREAADIARDAGPADRSVPYAREHFQSSRHRSEEGIAPDDGLIPVRSR